jgi:hypothetical protein
MPFGVSDDTATASRFQHRHSGKGSSRESVSSTAIEMARLSKAKAQEFVTTGTADDYIIIGAFDRIVAILDRILSLNGHDLRPALEERLAYADDSI